MSDDKKLIILDIDETLLYATLEPLEYPEDFMAQDYFVYLRPHVHAFLAFCFEHFRVALWTSSNEVYAHHIAKMLFSDYPLEFVWARGRCTQKMNFEYQCYEYIKNLQKVKKRGFDLDHVIMVDNTPSKLRKNYGNLVAVKDFEGDRADDELQILMPYLLTLKASKNIRKIEKRGWQFKYRSL